MGKYPVYAIVALVFIGMIKLIQVTAFDVEQYKKNKESSFSDYSTKTAEKESDAKVEDTKIENDEANSSDTTSISSSEEFSPKQARADEDAFESSQSEVESTDETNSATYAGLDDLTDNYLAPILANLPSGQLREDVVIRYYKHEKDGEKVYSLRKLGYYIHEKEASETTGLGSNVLYYGSQVRIEDIQIVAFTLINSGLPIKSIEPTQYSWKNNSIEIGTDTLLVSNPILSQANIESFNK
ncbi:MAG: hypothetical protein ABJG47_04050 [Ekhidna sp.]